MDSLIPICPHLIFTLVIDQSFLFEFLSFATNHHLRFFVVWLEPDQLLAQGCQQENFQLELQNLWLHQQR